MALTDKTVTFIGGGHITRILAENLIRTGTLHPSRLVVSDPDRSALTALCERFSLVPAESNPDAVSRGDFVFINVPPPAVSGVVAELARGGYPVDKPIITLAAGIPISAYRPLGGGVPVVRALPNPPSRVGKGIAALAFNPRVTEGQKEDILELFRALGEVVLLKEDQVNAAMALSSPVSTYLFFQSLIDAGVRVGLNRDIAARIAYHTMTGSLEVWKQGRESPADLMAEASTPGGISVESIFTLDKYGFRAAVNEAIYNAVARADQFGNTSRTDGADGSNGTTN